MAVAAAQTHGSREVFESVLTPPHVATLIYLPFIGSTSKPYSCTAESSVLCVQRRPEYSCTAVSWHEDERSWVQATGHVS